MDERQTVFAEDLDPAQQSYYLNLFLKNKSKKVHVRNVKVTELKRTANDVASKQVAHVLKAQTLDEAISAADVGTAQLNMLGVFKGVSSEIVVSEAADAGDEDVDVVFHVEESSVLTGSTGVTVGNNEGKGEFKLNLVNLLGLGDRVAFTSSKSTTGAVGVDLSYTLPVAGSVYHPFSLHLFRDEAECAESSHHQYFNGVGAEYTTYSVLGATHTLKYELMWREIAKIRENASFSIRAQAGHSLKSCIKHTAKFAVKLPSLSSTLDVSVNNEIAGLGLGGNTNHMRDSVQASLVSRLAPGWTMQLSFWGGVLRPFAWTNPEADAVQNVLSQSAYTRPTHSTVALPPSQPCLHFLHPAFLVFERSTADGDAASSVVLDRFFLGGSTDVRGFEYRGVGPRDHRDVLGGDAFAALGLHLYAPLPITAWRKAVGNAITTHVFATAGSLVSSWVGTRSWTHLLERGLAGAAASAGAGLRVKTGPFQMEFNVVYPFVFGPTDRPVKGVQLGAAVTFL